jgi:Flp pilus assembly protein TadB
MPWSDPRSPSSEESPPVVPAGDARERERSAATMLGWFHLVLAAPVLAGFWFSSLAIDRMLSAASAVAFAAVGCFFLWMARRLARRRLPPS